MSCSHTQNFKLAKHFPHTHTHIHTHTHTHTHIQKKKNPFRSVSKEISLVW